MRKQFLLFSIIVPTLLLGAFSFLKLEKNNTYQQVKATQVVEDGKYFILNSDGTRALYKGNSIYADDDAKANVSVPLDFEYNSETQYYSISVTINETTHYLRGDAIGRVNLRNDTTRCKDWTITYDGESKLYSLKLSNNVHLYYSSEFRLDTASDYNIQLIPVSSFITGMATVPCAGESDTEAKREAWADLKESLDVTVKNYLKNIPADIDADVDTLAGALAKYDYIVVKYNDSTNYPDFLERDPDPSAYGFMYIPSSSNSSSSDIYMITSLSILIGVSIITSLSMYLTIKKKHK